MLKSLKQRMLNKDYRFFLNSQILHLFPVIMKARNQKNEDPSQGYYP